MVRRADNVNLRGKESRERADSQPVLRWKLQKLPMGRVSNCFGQALFNHGRFLVQHATTGISADQPPLAVDALQWLMARNYTVLVSVLPDSRYLRRLETLRVLQAALTPDQAVS